MFMLRGVRQEMTVGLRAGRSEAGSRLAEEGEKLTMSNEFAPRLEILQKLADRLEQRRDDLIEAEGEDIGTPCTAVAMEVDMAVEHLRTMAQEVPLVAGKAPYGTVAAILPYDAPPVMVARVGGAAILGGNRFRFSCSSQTPRTARLLSGSGGGVAGLHRGGGPGQPGIRAGLRPGPRSQGLLHLRRRRSGGRLRTGRPTTSTSSFSPGPAACRR